MNAQIPIPFNNTYIELPGRFYTAQNPTPVKAPQLIRANHELADKLGIDPKWLASGEAVQVLSGNKIAEGSQPIATVYAGHQFGGWNPQLGDGRAILLGEVIDKSGQRFDVQLKGAGQTPYSRMGDGRSPLGPVLREYIVSEAMCALGIPSTRSLAAVTTGEYVMRDAVLPGAILTRIARSHIRVGHFQFFLAREDKEGLRLLADHVIARDFPLARKAENPYLELLKQVISRQAQLIAKWQLVGFIHGVMNTDNMLLCGETIDYGPCAFMDSFDKEACYSSIDHGKRYCYQNQPGIAHWNLAWLAQSLLTLIGDDKEKVEEQARVALNGFVDEFRAAYDTGVHRKLGLTTRTGESRDLLDEMLRTMQQHNMDFTLTFRRLSDLADNQSKKPAVDYEFPEAFIPLFKNWEELRSAEQTTPAQQQVEMYRANPAHIPRNHLVEEAIRAAEDNADFQPFNDLVEVLALPYEFKPENSRYTLPAERGEVVHKTFCGT